LQSNLLALEAFAQSQAGNEHAAWQALHQADALLGTGSHGDDPQWLDFWDEADLACIETRVAQSLGQLPLAERRIRAAINTVRPEYQRNRTSYLARHSTVLLEQRNLEEAVSTAAQAVVGASDVSSARIDAQISQVRGDLSPYSDQPTVAEFLDWSGQIMAAKTNGLVV
jgi:hypothetical protein